MHSSKKPVFSNERLLTLDSVANYDMEIEPNEIKKNRTVPINVEKSLEPRIDSKDSERATLNLRRTQVGCSSQSQLLKRLNQKIKLKVETDSTLYSNERVVELISDL